MDGRRYPATRREGPKKKRVPFRSTHFPLCCAGRKKDSSRGGTRTPDPVINSHLLYHLSYSGIAPQISRSHFRNQPTAPGLGEGNPQDFSQSLISFPWQRNGTAPSARRRSSPADPAALDSSSRRSSREMDSTSS